MLWTFSLCILFLKGYFLFLLPRVLHCPGDLQRLNKSWNIFISSFLFCWMTGSVVELNTNFWLDSWIEICCSAVRKRFEIDLYDNFIFSTCLNQSVSASLMLFLLFLFFFFFTRKWCQIKVCLKERLWLVFVEVLSGSEWELPNRCQQELETTLNGSSNFLASETGRTENTAHICKGFPAAKQTFSPAAASRTADDDDGPGMTDTKQLGGVRSMKALRSVLVLFCILCSDMWPSSSDSVVGCYTF